MSALLANEPALAPGVPLRVLQLEDNPDDAELALRQLRRAGMNAVSRRVETQLDFVEALEAFAPDIVLVDFSLPSFDGRTALQHVRRVHPEIPVIIVSGVLGDEQAVELIRAGARDFVLKDRLARLPSAVSQALEQARERRRRGEAERRVREQEAWFRTVFETAPLPKVIASCTGHIQQVNAAFTALLGYAPDEIRGRPIEDITHPEDRALSRARTDQVCCRAAERLQYEKRYLRRDGGTLWALTTVTGVELNGQRYVVGQIVDLTATKQALVERARMHDRLKTAMEGAGAGSWEMEGVRGTMTWDPVLRDQYGLRDDEPAPDVAGWLKLVHGEDQQRLRNALQALTAGESDHFNEEFRVPARDGSLRWFHSFGRVSRDVQGQVVRANGINIDITSQVEAHAAQRRLAEIVATSQDGIVSASLDLRITSWNAGAQAILGYTEAEATGVRVQELFAPECRPGIATQLAALRSGAPLRDLETTGLRKDGTPVAVEITVSPMRDAAGAVLALSAIVRDITARKLQEQALARVTRALKALSRCNSTLVHATGEQQLYEDMVRVVVEAGDYQIACVTLAAAGGLRCAAAARANSADTSPVQDACEPLDDLQLRQCLDSGKPGIFQDLAADPALAHWHERVKDTGLRSVVMLPLRDVKGVFGVLSILSIEAGAFGHDEMRLLTEMAEDLSFGIATLRARADHEFAAARLERSMEATVRALASTVEMRDPYTAGHQGHVAEIAVRLGRQMGLPEEMLRGLHLAASIHDIGKLCIPAEILAKPGRLTPVEYELIKQHPDAGARILDGIEFPWPIREIVWQHHERFDGMGYPRGLKGDQILLEARVLTVADVLEAVSAHRPYRPALGIPAALELLRQGRGTAFDERVVDACLALFGDATTQMADAA